MGWAQSRTMPSSVSWAAAKPDSNMRIAEMAKTFADAEVPTVAGSDACGAAGIIPGFALHDEFDLLAEEGLDPLTSPGTWPARSSSSAGSDLDAVLERVAPRARCPLIPRRHPDRAARAPGTRPRVVGPDAGLLPA